MGNSCSRGPVYTDDEECPTPQQQSRKLAKPRVGNPNIKKDKVSSNLPIPTPASEDVNESTSDATLVDREAIRQHIISTVFDLDGGRLGPDQRTPERTQICQDVQGRRYSLRSSTAKSESASSFSVRRGSRRGSLLSSPVTSITGEDTCLDGHHKSSQRAFSSNIFFRRRSLVSAAPPATRTRKETLQVPSTNISKKPSMQLDALDLVDLHSVRAQTPSGYSVLGGFKRGSLQIVNGEASPSSSVGDLRLKRRNTTPVPFKGAHSPLITESRHLATEQNDYFESQLVQGSYSGCLTNSSHLRAQFHTRSRSNSSFSFETAPETGGEPIVLIEDFPSTLLQPPVRRYSTRSESVITPRHSQSSLTSNTMEALTHPVQSSSYTHSKVFESPKYAPERRPSMKGGVDSGYCSTGSVNSRVSWTRRNSRTSVRSSQSEDKSIYDSVHSPTVQRYRQNSIQGAIAVEYEHTPPSRFMSRRSSTYSIPRAFSFTEQSRKNTLTEEVNINSRIQTNPSPPGDIRDFDCSVGTDFDNERTIAPGPVPFRIYDNSQVMAIDTRIESLQLLQPSGHFSQQKYFRRTSIGEAYHNRFSRAYGIPSY